MKNMKLRLLPLQTFNGPTNMALDEIIMDKVCEGSCLPTLRIYKWFPACVSIGYFQGLKQEINEEGCGKNGVDMVRRQTGGGAVFHDAELTYSLIVPEEYFSKDIKKSYEEICMYIVNALKRLGVKAKFSPINDILINNQKVSGNAQTRKKGILLQHGTILSKVDVEKMFSLLNVGKEKISDKLVASVKKAVTSLEQHGVLEKDFYDAFLEEFKEDYEFVEDTYSQEEIDAATKLGKEKYGHMHWIGMR